MNRFRRVWRILHRNYHVAWSSRCLTIFGIKYVHVMASEFFLMHCNCLGPICFRYSDKEYPAIVFVIFRIRRVRSATFPSSPLDIVARYRKQNTAF